MRSTPLLIFRFSDLTLSLRSRVCYLRRLAYCTPSAKRVEVHLKRAARTLVLNPDGKCVLRIKSVSDGTDTSPPVAIDLQAIDSKQKVQVKESQRWITPSAAQSEAEARGLRISVGDPRSGASIRLPPLEPSVEKKR